jgi:hypothetical protein
MVDGYACWLACAGFALGIPDQPPGMALSIKAAEAWLKDLAAGRTQLLGIQRSPVELAEQAGGQCAFVEATGSPGIPPDLYTRLRNMVC